MSQRKMDRRTRDYLYEISHGRRNDAEIAIRELTDENAYFRKALKLVCSNIPTMMLAKGGFKEFSSMLADRICIAQRALNGLPLEKETPSEEGAATTSVTSWARPEDNIESASPEIKDENSASETNEASRPINAR